MRRARLVAAAGALALIVLAGAAYVYFATRDAVQVLAAGRSGQALSNARASRDRGEYLYQTAARCAACHARDLGGAFVLRSAAVATLWGPNLTRGNPPVGVNYSTADFERAIRRGLRPNGMRLLLMPSLDYAAMSDDDVASVIAYIRAAPAVERPVPAFRLGALGRLMLLTGRLSFDSDRIGDTIPPAAGPAGGMYLARLGGCLRCHGAAGPAPLPASVGRATFAAVLNTGRDRSGRPVSDHAVPSRPWRDADLDALFSCFQHAGRPGTVAGC
jgi:mono/diheme cytochrome c family protein